MKIPTQCDKCNSQFSVDEKFIGQKAKCSKCGASFVVQVAPAGAGLQKAARIDLLPGEIQSAPPAVPPSAPRVAAAAAQKGPAQPPIAGAPPKAVATAPKAAAAPAPGPSSAAVSPDIFLIELDSSPRCPVCQNALAGGAVLCVNCGYDLRAGARVQYLSDSERIEKGVKKDPLKSAPEGKSPAKKRKGFFTPKRLKALAWTATLVGVFLGSIGAVWGAFALYGYFTRTWNQGEAFARLDNILSENRVSAKRLAQELPYVYAYFQDLPKRLPKYAAEREATFAATIHKIPMGTDLTPLLEFPPESDFYQPIYDLLKQQTNVQWRMEKSCDPSETARYYGGRLLAEALPFITLSDADQKSLSEKTEIDEKQRRFRALVGQSQQAAEKKIPGRYLFQLEVTFLRSKLPPSGLSPDGKQRFAKPPSPVLEAVYKDDNWLVTFFGQQWIGPIEQFEKLDLAKPLKEQRGLFEPLSFFSHLQEATMHLRFKENKFVVELEGLPESEFMSEFQTREIERTGFTGFRTSIVKVAP
jgi:predicted Zn finger-like uncharacterized protein